MKTYRILAATAVLAIAAAGTDAEAKSYKRGVSENSFALKEEIDVLKPGTCWFYNWANTPNKNIADLPDGDFEFIPMCWNANYNADAIRTYCKAHPETKTLLGFNEPNFRSQANMTPAEAAAKWPEVKALADELGLELVGPAVNHSPDGPDNDPYKWYAEFVKLVGTDAFDYIAIHNYSGGKTGMKEMIDRFFELYGKKIWLTEFCNWVNTVTPESQISSMVEQLEYLEKSDRVHRYSWFKAKGSISTSPCYGLIVPKNGYGERELSEQGKVYVYMTDFDETVFHSVKDLVPATEYIASKGLMLGSTNDTKNPKPIEITQFNAGAYTDYQFEIPAAGEYTLIIRASGMGDPTRFDPTIGIYSVDNDGNELATLCAPMSFALSNDNAVYQEVKFPMTLEAGKQRIRVKDTNPYMPSGIRLSTLSFDPNSGVESLAGDNGRLSCTVDGNGNFRIIGNAAAYSVTVGDLNGRIVFSGTVDDGIIPAGNLAHGAYLIRIASTDGTTTLKIIK